MHRETEVIRATAAREVGRAQRLGAQLLITKMEQERSIRARSSIRSSLTGGVGLEDRLADVRRSNFQPSRIHLGH